MRWRFVSLAFFSLFLDLKRVKVEQPSSTTPETTAATMVTSTSGVNKGVQNRATMTLQQQAAQQKQSTTPETAAATKRQQTLSEYVLACLANYGICVLDNFMGPVKTLQILQDAKQMDANGVSSKLGKPSKQRTK